MDKNEILAELQNRLNEKQKYSEIIRQLKESLFSQQREFVECSEKYRLAVCSRRAGKTHACVASLLIGALEIPGSVNVYATLTRSLAKKLVWKKLLDLCHQFRIEVKPNAVELKLTLLSNGSIIYLMGSNNQGDVDRFRGLGIRGTVVLDEVQSFPNFIAELVDDVLEPATVDGEGGKLILLGTPSAIKETNYLYKQTLSDAYAKFHWTYWDNPTIKDHQGQLAKILGRRGVKITDASIRREYFGEWVTSSDSLVFRYDQKLNDYDELPISHSPWQFIIGADVGFTDADAIAVLAFNDEDPNTYLVEELVQAKQTISAFVEQIKAFYDKYQPIKIVMDPGGGGRKIIEEISSRWHLPIKSAEKQSKQAFIELLNDSLRTGRFKAKSTSRFAHDCGLLEWDMDKSSGDKMVVSSRFHSDIGDAGLYAFRESLAYLSQRWSESPKPGTPEWYKAEADRMEQEVQLAYDRAKNPDDFDVWNGIDDEP